MIAAAFVGCGGGKGGPPATPQCLQNSNCKAGLICALGYCVNACTTSADCTNPTGARCIVADVSSADGGTDGSTDGGTKGNVCQPPETVHCAHNSDCKAPLVCGVDLQCRDQCEQDVDCPSGQKCTSISKLCADPLIDKNYDPATNDFKIADGGAGGGSGGGHDGGGGSSDGGSVDADAGPSCVSPQTQFGNVAVGDANPNFTSGVGVRNASKFFVFSGYSGPDPAADGGVTDAAPASKNFVYVQSFNVTSGISDGPAVPLLARSDDGPYFNVADAAIAPTGEIALLHSSGTVADGAQSQLYVTFLKPAPTGDAGTGGLQVVKILQIETAHEAVPHVFWSVPAQSFVVSWKYLTTAWYTRIRTFSLDGSSAGGTTVVPTPYGSDNDYQWQDARVGTSGQLFGVIHRQAATSLPELTFLGLDGLQVGGFVELENTFGINWAAVGGTTQGFVALYNGGTTAYGAFVPTTGSMSAVQDGGVGANTDAGTPSFTSFNFPTTASQVQAISDDSGGVGGVGAVLLESNGASFLYVTADGSKHLLPGTILVSAHGAQVSIANYHGSFTVSLYDSTTHATQISASGCRP